jgi:hypothetical protein
MPPTTPSENEKSASTDLQWRAGAPDFICKIFLSFWIVIGHLRIQNFRGRITSADFASKKLKKAFEVSIKAGFQL